MTFWCGSGSCYFRHVNLQDANKKLIFKKRFSAYYFLKEHLHHFSKTKVKKKSHNSRNQGFYYYFCLMIEGSVNTEKTFQEVKKWSISKEQKHGFTLAYVNLSPGKGLVGDPVAALLPVDQLDLDLLQWRPHPPRRVVVHPRDCRACAGFCQPVTLKNILIYVEGRVGVADPGCLSRIPDPDFTATKERGEKNLLSYHF